MAEPFVGEIRMFAGNFAPRGWAFCDGQLLAVSQNDTLFSLLGTIYGGDGRTTFGLPDMRGRVPIHAGEGPGLSARRLGSKGGTEKVTLTVNQMPSHSHPANSANENADNRLPEGQLPAIAQGDLYASRPGGVQSFSAQAITSTGGSRSHTNEQPFLCVHFIMALFGIFPSQH